MKFLFMKPRQQIKWNNKDTLVRILEVQANFDFMLQSKDLVLHIRYKINRAICFYYNIQFFTALKKMLFDTVCEQKVTVSHHHKENNSPIKFRK